MNSKELKLQTWRRRISGASHLAAGCSSACWRSHRYHANRTTLSSKSTGVIQMTPSQRPSLKVLAWNLANSIEEKGDLERVPRSRRVQTHLHPQCPKCPYRGHITSQGLATQMAGSLVDSPGFGCLGNPDKYHVWHQVLSLVVVSDWEKCNSGPGHFALPAVILKTLSHSYNLTKELRANNAEPWDDEDSAGQLQPCLVY